MKKGLWILVIVIVVIAIIGFTQGSKKAELGDGPIKIGFVGPLTGDAATIGQSALVAAQIAVDEINADGGIDGHQIELISENGQCTGAIASDAANKLINADGVVAINGGACSAETSAFVAQAEAAKVPVVSYCSSAPALTEAGDYFFRTFPSDSYEGVFAAGYMKNTLGLNKVAVLYTNDDWGVGIQQTFINEFKKLGGEVAVVESFEKSARDLRTQLTKIKSANVEGIYFPAFSEASIPGIRQLAELGLNTMPIFGANAWTDPKIWDEVGTAGDGLMFAAAKTPTNLEFEQKFAAKNETITLCAAQSYDNIKILAEVIGKVGVDGEKIKDALYNVNYTEGVSAGKIMFDKNGDLVGAEYEVSVVENGKPVVK